MNDACASVGGRASAGPSARPTWFFLLSGVALLMVGAGLHDPFLASIEAWATPVGGVVGGLGLAGALRRLVARRRRSWWDVGSALTWGAALSSILATVVFFQIHRFDVLDDGNLEARRLGPRFVVGYTRFEDVERLARLGLIGGVYLTRRNLRGGDGASLRAEIAALQEARRERSLPPLIVAADQEGGVVSHLSPPLPALPPLSVLTKLPAAARSAAAFGFGALHGWSLAGLGVTTNFAPVVDVGWMRAPSSFDALTRIRRRAISSDPEVVGKMALAYSRGLLFAGVTPTLKHFPGLGRVDQDTHLFRAALSTPVAVLEAEDWRPFRAVLSQASALLMVGHVIVSAIDPDNPASHSRRVIEDVVRRAWGHQGVLITDDLSMGAISHYGLCGAVIETLNAGVDLALIAYDARLFYRAMSCAAQALRQGRIFDDALRAGDARLETFFAAQKNAKTGKDQILGKQGARG